MIERSAFAGNEEHVLGFLVELEPAKTSRFGKDWSGILCNLPLLNPRVVAEFAEV